MSALENKLNWIKQCAELLLKDVDLAISSYKEEQKKNTGQENQVWLVRYKDECWYYDSWFTRIFKDWKLAYNYYKGMAELILDGYKKHNPNLIIWFEDRTSYNNNDYPEFIIDNEHNWDCQTIYEYEEVNLQWFTL